MNRRTENERKFLWDLQVTRIVIAIGWPGSLLKAAPAASGRDVVVIKDGEVTDDLAQYGRQSAERGEC